MPSGSLAIQASAGPETAAPSPTIAANKTRINNSAPTGLGARIRSSQLKIGCISRLSMIAKTSGRTISLATLAAIKTAKRKMPPRKKVFASEGRGISANNSSGATVSGGSSKRDIEMLQIDDAPAGSPQALSQGWKLNHRLGDL